MSGINLRLNNGCYCHEACRKVLQDFSGDFRLALYTDEHNERLLSALAAFHRVPQSSLVLGNGSGPLLSRGMAALLEKQIRSSVLRSAKHLVNGSGYPLVTPELTYSKVPFGARARKLRIVFTNVIERERRFRIDLDHLDATLAKTPGLVYIVSPGNPNGTVVFERADMIALMKRRPESMFWLDEAYIELLEPELAQKTALIRHVSEVDNLVVSRSFSFAYGLAGARIGYVVAPAWAAKLVSGTEPGFRLGVLQEELALAALASSEDHLRFITEYTRKERTKLEAALAAHASLEVFASDTHQVLCRFNDGREGEWLAAELMKHDIAIRHFALEAKTFLPKLAAFFRLCVGRPEENAAFEQRLDEVLGKTAAKPLRAVS